jgi:hypothetical protein
MDTHSRGSERAPRDLSKRQPDRARFLLVLGIAVVLGGGMYVIDPSDVSWLGCWVLALMIGGLSHLPRGYELHRVVKAWLGLVLVIFTGGIVFLALNLGLSPYWAAVYAGLAGMAIERVRLFDFKLHDLWAGKPEEEDPQARPLAGSWRDRSTWVNPDEDVRQREGADT